jgi:integrase
MLSTGEILMIESHRFQNGSLARVKNKSTPDTWFFRFYEQVGGNRVYRNRKIGTAREYPHRRDAEKAVLALRGNINIETRSPETVNDLIAHYSKIELSEEGGKRTSTRQVYEGYLRVQIAPNWGQLRLDQLKAVAVEKWLRSLNYAPGTLAKIRNIMSAVFTHAKRYDMIQTNPIEGVRCSSKRMRTPDVLTPDEFKSLLHELPQRERVMVMLVGTTGLRRSELIALTWHDVDFNALQVDINKSCVRAQIAATKTAASSKPVPLLRAVANSLLEWRRVTQYPTQEDFLFPSIRNHGKTPLWPDMILNKVIRPAAERAGICGKRIGWHTFRHSLGTNLRFLGVDVKTAQELLRHANAKITLDLYSQAVSSQKREASTLIGNMMLPSLEASEILSTV